MHRIDSPGHDNNTFTEGNPGTGTPATEVSDEWLNAVQEEISHVIEEAGIELSKPDNTQLAVAIHAMIAAGAPTVEGDRVFITDATFAAGTQNNDAVYWDSANSRFDQAIADGTEKQSMVGFADVTGGEVTLYGNMDTLSGLTPGRYYLSGDTAGAITQNAPANPVPVGYAKSATTIFVDTESIPAASDTQKGIAERATNAEVIAGVDDERFITPATLMAAFDRSLTSAGYQKLPGGLMMMWTYILGGDGDYITFPFTFPGGVYSLQLTDLNISLTTDQAHVLGYKGLTSAGFTLASRSLSGAVIDTGVLVWALGK